MNILKKRRMIEVNRYQSVLRAIDVEKLVDECHSVRAVWDFVGRLDLAMFYEAIESYEGEAGRPAWDPRLLVSVWIYAYSQGIGSAREIERRCDYDPAFQWLTGLEAINHHTLSDFRIDQKDSLDELFKQTLALLSTDGLISMERVMHDGTKIKAFASGNTFRREARIKEFLKKAEEQILAMGDPRNDSCEVRKQRAQERSVRERKEKLELALKELELLRLCKVDKESKVQARVSVSDPQARVMKQSDGGFAPSYNAQISTDSANGIIVGASISQSGTDTHELLPAITTIEENLGTTPIQMVVDGGYTHSKNIIEMDNRKIDLIGSLPDIEKTVDVQYERHGIAEEFRLENFIYDPTSNCFICPTGKRLGPNGSEKRKGDKKILYIAKTTDCQSCPFKSKCCPNAKRGRAVSRKIEQPAVAAFKKKMETEEAKQIYKQRSAVAEFSNAWIKSKVKLRQFCLQGKEKVELELQWACIAINIQYWTRLRWLAE